MIITKVRQAKRDPERVNVYLDSEFWTGLDKNTLVEFHLYEGLEVSTILASEILFADRVRYLHRRLLSFWFVRPRSSREFKTKARDLLHKLEEKVSHNELDRILHEVLGKLSESSYDDNAFAKWFVSERERQGKYGMNKIYAELLSKGVDRQIASSAVSHLKSQSEELKAKLLQKKFGVANIKEIPDLKLRQKAYLFLKSRGL